MAFSVLQFFSEVFTQTHGYLENFSFVFVCLNKDVSFSLIRGQLWLFILNEIDCYLMIVFKIKFTLSFLRFLYEPYFSR